MRRERSFALAGAAIGSKKQVEFDSVPDFDKLINLAIIHARFPRSFIRQTFSEFTSPSFLR